MRHNNEYFSHWWNKIFGIHMVNELLTAGHDVTIATRGKASDSFGDKVDNGRFH